ncbi:MAG: glycoside hydrolase family 28 protein [Bacteroides graminisolvens]|nr:glycoside hydrolase family 28 protein [Bacteroides graminisolvens]MBP6140361.1 glycoside hydrolase family 28 protein [Bacteroides sp.]MBP7293709.1 glycoside hydrolase family 28 protein [Bacteroides sp.]MCD8496588.1 glycoside hydrolase family 28 protein [Bacteroides graminisolvens]MDD3211818.1 glycoside hydrolase family 28 protein [Bacteroides graminisolvens]MEA4885363.1 glycoside hydrolase family 28 protein [Bacteroides graminisolvens]
MKQAIGVFTLLLVALCARASNIDFDKAFKESAKIEKQIKRTSFAKRTFYITDFGAKPHNEAEPCHEAINQAITACSLAGGGTVVVPKGTFFTGPITLKSNVNLHVSEGATLKFSTDQSLYFPGVITRWEGIDCYNARPLIYAYGETNIAITGKGTIDGQGSKEAWWPMCGAPRYGWKEGMVAQRNGGRERLLMYGETNTPIYKRIMTPEDGMRPQLINLYSCNTVLIEDVTLLNSPFWVIHPLFCESLIVRGVNIFNRGPNGDGCDPESCKNVLIENCVFDTGDDCIAIKSGRNNDGRKWNIPSENIIVRGCKMKNGHGGVVIGSEISGGYRNLFVENCEMDSPELDRVIRIKTSTCRGGVIENVFVRNVTVGQCREAVLRINLQYENRENCQRGFTPTVRNVHLKNVTCQKSQLGVLIIGLEDPSLVNNISVEDSHFNNVAKDGNDIKSAKDVTFKNLYINGRLVSE